MPRIAQKAEVYALEDLKKELLCRMILSGLPKVENLAAAMRVPTRTVYNWLEDIESLDIRKARKLFQVLKPDPKLALKLLGYSAKEISKLSD